MKERKASQPPLVVSFNVYIVWVLQIRRPSLQGELPPTADATRQPDAALATATTATAATTATTTRRTGISSSLPIRQPSGPFVVEQRRRSGRGRLSMSGRFRTVAHSQCPRPAHRRRSDSKFLSFFFLEL